MNTKRYMIIAALILVAGLAAIAPAQSKADLEINPPQPIDNSITLQLNAVEVSDGVVGLDPRYQKSETIFGYAFLGRTTGELPGSFMFSMNCFPAAFTPGELNEITGGVWTLPVYARPFKGLNNVYMGSLYGNLVGGNMQWDKEGNAGVFFTFNVDGGTQTWDGAQGYGTFKGLLTRNEKGTSTLSGELNITYLSVTKY